MPPLKPILRFCLVLVVIGFVVWLINAYVPLPSVYLSIINVVLPVAIVIYIAYWFLNQPGP